MNILGRVEKVNFPNLQLFDIDAKIDTGAYTTALHCHDIMERTENNKKKLFFKLLDPSHPDYNEREIVFNQYEKKQIKNSFGDLEERFVIKTTIQIGNRKIKTLMSLTDRGSMKYPVLIGRRLLRNQFAMDVSKIYTQLNGNL